MSWRNVESWNAESSLMMPSIMFGENTPYCSYTARWLLRHSAEATQLSGSCFRLLSLSAFSSIQGQFTIGAAKRLFGCAAGGDTAVFENGNGVRAFEREGQIVHDGGDAFASVREFTQNFHDFETV